MKFMTIADAQGLGCRETLRATDAWGRSHFAEIEWRALPVFGADRAQENVNKVPTLWADEPPVQWTMHNGTPELTKLVREVHGSHSVVCVPVEVTDPDAVLQAGEYRVIREG